MNVELDFNNLINLFSFLVRGLACFHVLASTNALSEMRGTKDVPFRGRSMT